MRNAYLALTPVVVQIGIGLECVSLYVLIQNSNNDDRRAREYKIIEK